MKKEIVLNAVCGTIFGGIVMAAFVIHDKETTNAYYQGFSDGGKFVQGNMEIKERLDAKKNQK